MTQSTKFPNERVLKRYRTPLARKRWILREADFTIGPLHKSDFELVTWLVIKGET